jgi:hypothetical protein
MRRPIRRALPLMLAAGITAACGSDNNTLPTAPTTLPTVLTETFSGSLPKNAGFTHPFTVSDAGDVTVFLLTSAAAADPNNAVPVGISLGTWNGSSCAVVLANDNSMPGTSIPSVTGRATAAGNLCVRVYDVGFVPGTANYELLIDHY